MVKIIVSELTKKILDGKNPMVISKVNICRNYIDGPIGAGIVRVELCSKRSMVALTFIHL